MPATHPTSSGHFNSAPTTAQGRVRGGGPTAPEATKPAVAVPPTAATPLPVTPAPAQTPAPPITGNGQNATNTYVNSVMSAINTAVIPNALNKFYQSTYHFRLFVMADGDFVSPPPASGRPAITSLSDLSKGIDSAKQVTIAESGVTGFNIKSVQIITAASNNAATRSQSALEFKMVIIEPNGLSFLDAFIDAAVLLKLKSWPKATYYLELRFLGYDESGNIINGQAATDAIGRWVWSLKPQNIDVSINEGGGTYTLSFAGNATIYLTDDYDIMRVPEPFQAKGNTLKDLFADYIDKVNKAVVKKYGGPVYVFDKIVTFPVKDFFSHPPGAGTKDPGTFVLKPQTNEKNPKRNWGMDTPTDLYTVNAPPGQYINEFITDAIKHTEEGQSLAKDDSNVKTKSDASPTSTNERGFRESITWTIEPIVKDMQFDHTTGHYVKTITLYVTPFYAQIATASRPQADKAKDPSVQKDMITSLIANGLLQKRYDYIFTGLNTEVIEFDLNFNLPYSARLANYSGALMRHAAFAVNARLNKVNQPESNLSEVVDKAQFEQFESPSIAGGSGVTAPSPTPSPARLATGTVGSPQVTQSVNNIYIEDLLTAQAAADFAVPIALWQGNKDIESNSGGGNFIGTMDRDQSMVGAIWSQVLKVDNYIKLNMTIRGDPFWLGQSNLQRQILLINGALSVKGNTTITHENSNNHIFVYFRYPLTTGDEFKPDLKTSAVFNGIYLVIKVTHTFADGVFKQELEGARHYLLDPSKWTTSPTSTSPTAQNNGGPSSSSDVVPNNVPTPNPTTPNSTVFGPLPQSSSPSSDTSIPPPSSNDTTTVGVSPVAGDGTLGTFVPGNKASFVSAFTPLAQQQSAATGIAPEVILAQAGLETGWGNSAPQNNFFGIKGSGGASLATQEVVNGQTINTTANFQGYQSSTDSFNGYSTFINNNPRFSNVAGAGGIAQQAQAIQAAGYATDPNYASKITSIANGIHIPTTGSTITLK